MPIWSKSGKKTTKREDTDKCDVNFTPLLPILSSTTCTRTSWPSLNHSLIFSVFNFLSLKFSSESSSSFSKGITSDKCKNPAFSKLISTKVHPRKNPNYFPLINISNNSFFDYRALSKFLWENYFLLLLFVAHICLYQKRFLY